MLPIYFDGCNRNFGPPPGMTDEQCDTVPGMFYTEQDKFPYCLLELKPNLEDLNAMNRDKYFYLKLCSFAISPFSFWVNSTQCNYRFDSIGFDIADIPYSCFKVFLTDEQLKDINNGKDVYYKVLGNTIIPFACWTMNENNEVNF